MIKNNLIILQFRRKQSKTECKIDIFMSISRNKLPKDLTFAFECRIFTELMIK